ncbi:MAG: hypothetical protein CME16_01910, partial [Gemmatimonadetes bacterium]|nr:hypothetical protein [Gemmatimonadota bacterium]
MLKKINESRDMAHFFATILLLCIFLPGAAAGGRAEYVLGGDGNPWAVTLQEQAGFYQLYGADNQVIDSLPVGTSPQWTGKDTLVTFARNDTLRPVWI